MQELEEVLADLRTGAFTSSHYAKAITCCYEHKADGGAQRLVDFIKEFELVYGQRNAVRAADPAHAYKERIKFIKSALSFAEFQFGPDVTEFYRDTVAKNGFI